MALFDKLTAIADGFRASRGLEDKLSLEQMATLAAQKIELPDLMPASSLPDYVSPEVLDVANKVKSVQKDDSIVFIAMADSHYPADESGISCGGDTIKSAVQTNQAAKALTYLLKPDFVAHLGDIGAGAGSTTPDMLKTQITEFLSYFREASSDLPVFLCIGNHDTNTYYNKAQNGAGNTGVFTLPGDWLYENFTAHSASDDTVFGNTEHGGYCYRDFATKKLRVFLLNTSEKLVGAPQEKYNDSDQATYGAQRVWLANALLDLNSKADAAEWSFIVLSHYPADYGATMPLSELLKAYVEGSSCTIKDPNDGGYFFGDRTNQTVSFSGKNAAKFLAQFHGHIHNLLSSRLYDNATGTPVQYDAWRICVPNGECNPARDNYYGTFGGISYQEDQNYPKTVDTANGTSFVVNVINLSDNVIYSFCYGAGYDRTISLEGIAYYSIHTDLTGATIESSATSIREGDSYTGAITVTEGYTLDSVVVTMGGEDITDEVYADGVVTIPEVTGTVVITVIAEAPPVNLLTVALDTDGSLYNGGTGYKSGYRISTSGSGEKVSSGSYVSGYIPINLATDTLKLYNIGTETVNESKAYLIGFNALSNTTNGQVALASLTANDDGSLTIGPDMWAGTDLTAVKYVRLSCSYIGDDSSVIKA